MKAKWGLFMTEQKKNTIITSGIAVLAVILAYCLRIVGRGSFYPMLFSYLRSFIYIGLFAAWGLSVRQRIVQKQVCRFMTVTAVLLIIWMVVRSAKYFIFWQPDAVRYLWYLFYLPMLFVPMLALLIAMSLGKPDEYKFPKGMSILWIISGTLLLLVLTNDLHQFVFTFPKDAAVWTDKNNGYSIGYFIIVGWQVLCAFAALVIMFSNAVCKRKAPLSAHCSYAADNRLQRALLCGCGLAAPLVRRYCRIPKCDVYSDL